MEGRVVIELHDIKRSLEKCLQQDNTNEEQISDLLGALERLQVTPKLIKESKLGNVIATIKSKFKASAPKLSEQAVQLLASWKRLVESSTAVEHHAEAPKEDKKDKPSPAKFVAPSSSSSRTAVDASAVSSSVNSLPASRKSVYIILLNTLKPACPENVAMNVALQIEAAICAQFPAESQLKAYTNKAKTLSFNLKKNEALREHVVCGVISSTDLVALSAADLASHEQKMERERLQAEVVDARRSDWLEAHKAELQHDIGIDPNNTWSFDNGEDGNNSEPDVEGD